MATNFVVFKTQICFFLFMLSQVSNGHEDDMYTVQYTKETFLDEIKEKNNFIMFYAPWYAKITSYKIYLQFLFIFYSLNFRCGHCQRLGPTWAQLAEMYNEADSNIKIAKVDCTVDSTLCSEHDVTGYPTYVRLKFFKAGESKGIKFRGTRDLASLTSFINDQLGSISMVMFIHCNFYNLFYCSSTFFS